MQHRLYILLDYITNIGLFLQKSQDFRLLILNFLKITIFCKQQRQQPPYQGLIRDLHHITALNSLFGFLLPRQLLATSRRFLAPPTHQALTHRSGDLNFTIPNTPSHLQKDAFYPKGNDIPAWIHDKRSATRLRNEIPTRKNNNKIPSIPHPESFTDRPTKPSLFNSHDPQVRRFLKQVAGA